MSEVSKSLDDLISIGQADKDELASEGTGRRSFLTTAMVGGIGACYLAALGYPVYRYMASPVERAEAESAISEVSLTNAVTLAPGSALMFKFGSFPALLIHHMDGTWSAFNAVCTHLGCTVAYEPAKNRIHCACHGGVYDPNTGKNVSGPPPRPLKAYVVKVTDKTVVVSRA